jgi:hypothetical protein
MGESARGVNRMAPIRSLHTVGIVTKVGGLENGGLERLRARKAPQDSHRR